MRPTRVVVRGGTRDALELSSAAGFAILWDAMAEMLGTAAVAAIVRRAAKRATVLSPELAHVVIVRTDLGYRYTLPDAWSQAGGEATALRTLVAEIWRLLHDLTGTVVTCRLERIPELAGGLIWAPRDVN